MMTRASISALVAAMFLQLPCAHGQEFNFGTDLVDGVETGRIDGGFATGYMNIAIDGNTLTAVLRNTSPDDENYGADNSISSPAIRRFNIDVTDVTGESLSLSSWQLTGVDADENDVILGGSSGSDQGIREWRASGRNDTFRFRARKQNAYSPLYNPGASGGFPSSGRYFTQAVLTATFSATIGSADLNPEIRFTYVGSRGARPTLSGVRAANASVQPEPTSLVVWSGGGLLAVVFGRRRKGRRGTVGTKAT